MALSEETRLVLGLVSMFLAGLLLIALAAWLGGCSVLPWKAEVGVPPPAPVEPTPWLTLTRSLVGLGSLAAAGGGWWGHRRWRAQNGGQDA